MSNFGALWDVAKPLTPTQSNPQGNLALPVGSLAVSPCGYLYVKRGGGSTAFGWYLLASDQYLNWQPKWVNGAGNMTISESAQSIAGGGGTLINFLPSKSSGAGSADPKRGYVGGYTTGVALNTFLMRLTNNTDSMPAQRIDDSVLLNFQEFDCWWDVFTTPRSSSVAGSTDLTTGSMRIWAGGAWGSTAVQTSGGSVSSDTLFTEWPVALTATNGLFAWAFRFSSAIDALTWQLVTANAPGGVAAQTVTPMGPIAINTAYRLRVRFVLVAGVLTCLASINDGTEIAVTGNVGPGATPVGNQIQPFQPLASLRTVNGTVKSLVFAQCAMNYGIGVGVNGC